MSTPGQKSGAPFLNRGSTQQASIASVPNVLEVSEEIPDVTAREYQVKIHCRSNCATRCVRKAVEISGKLLK
jgi:hypothetical protein